MEEPFVFKVNLGGMIDILANHLYSSPDVFIRELLQNGTDAISGRQERHISIGTYASVSVHWLPDIIAEFRKSVK